MVAFVLAAASLYAVGLVVATVAPSKAAAGIGTVLWFPIMFFARILWVPRRPCRTS